MKVLTCFALLAALSCQLFGQAAAGNITGTVTDASGAAVPKAKVDLQNAATGVVHSTLTDAGGVYRFTNLRVGTGTGPSVGGQRPRNNSFNVEGVDNNRKDVTGPIVYVPNDAVAEFSLLQNQFSAEHGHSSGGQFNTVIRGGTNDLHGGIYEY